MALLEAFVQGMSRVFDGAQRLRLSQWKSLSVVQVEPEGAELAREGFRFYSGFNATPTGRAPVATIPTTAAAFLLWNGEADDGRSYMIDKVAIAQLSGTAAVGAAILFALTTAKIAAPTGATGYAVCSASRGNRLSKAVIADNQTLGATPIWGILDANGNPATTTNGGQSSEVKGRVLVPPGFGLAIHVLSGAGTTPLFLSGFQWAELDFVRS